MGSITPGSSGNIITTMQYDTARNQISLSDPSLLGPISYTYNGFGEMVSQVNPGSITNTLSYLPDGRISQKIAPDDTLSYSYNSNKQLANISSSHGISRTFQYDSKGRIYSITESIPGNSPFATSTTYDTYGRQASLTHPSGITETYNYQNGYITSITAGGKTRWEITGVNAYQQITSGRYQNNLTANFGYDDYGFLSSIVTDSIQDFRYHFNQITGNLDWRKDSINSITENFQYDNLDRLTTVQKGSQTTLSMTYDVNTGALTSKSDFGSFIYGNTSRPYSITKIEPIIGPLPNGNQTILYTSSNKVKSITENNYEASFIYGPDDTRDKFTLKQNGNTILTRWFPTDTYVKEVSSSITKEYTFIGGDAYSAKVVAVTQNGSTNYYSLLRDHLGSITHVLDSIGAIIAEYSYDAWGRMRNPTTWENYLPGSEPQLFISSRGYTGHEHMPWFSLINMNGRIFDPVNGMFLSPDPFIQEPYNLQNLNRYSYCQNNPLCFIDPSGYRKDCKGEKPGPHSDDFEELLSKVWNGIKGIFGASKGNGYIWNDLYADINGWAIPNNESNSAPPSGPGGGGGPNASALIYIPGYSHPWIVPMGMLKKYDLLADYIRKSIFVLTTRGGAYNIYHNTEAMFSDVGFSFLGSGRTVGGFFILAGYQKGSFHPYKEWAAGGGTTASLSYEFGFVNSNGDPLKFSSNYLYGIRDKIWAGWGEFLSGGIGIAVSEYEGNRITAISFQFSLGAGFPIDCGYNKGVIDYRTPWFKSIYK